MEGCGISANNAQAAVQTKIEEAMGKVEHAFQAREEAANAIKKKIDAAIEKAFEGVPTTPDVHEEVTTSVAQIVSSPNFDFNQMSIDAVISAVMLDRYNALQDVVKKQADKVQEMNNQLRALGQLKALLAVYGNDVSKPDDKVTLDKPGSTGADIQNLANTYDLDIDWSSVGLEMGRTNDGHVLIGSIITRGNLAKLNQLVDTATTSVTNLQSVEYNKLQDYAQKLTQALDLASNVSKKFADTNSGMIGNMR